MSDVIVEKPEVYCICKRPYNNEYMIACDICLFNFTYNIGDAWYHPECIGLSVLETKKIKEYECFLCLAGKPFEPWSESKVHRKKSLLFDFTRESSDYPLEKSFYPINERNPLVLKEKFEHPGHVNAMCVSHDGSMLASCSGNGTVKIFDLNTLKEVMEYRDLGEKQIDEFFVVGFSRNDHFVVTGGKRKDRYKWEEKEKDNKIIDCPLKMFSLLDPSNVVSIVGHTEEITCLKIIEFEGHEYFVSSAVDGSIMKCRFRKNFIDEKVQIMDGLSSTVYSLSFLPGRGNKYFLAATDDNIKLFDFKCGDVLQEFLTGFEGGLCNCVKFIQYEEDDMHLILKGATRDLEVDFKMNWRCSMKKLTRVDDQFELLDIADFHHKEFESTEYCPTLVWNGNYVFATGVNGKVFIWNDKGKSIAILNDHGDKCVRDIKIHPILQYLFTSGDDGFVYVFEQADP
jgi:WD40 repeat protein